MVSLAGTLVWLTLPGMVIYPGRALLAAVMVISLAGTDTVGSF